MTLLDVFRVLVILMLCSVGILHLIWFLPAWTSMRAGVGDGRWALPGNVTIRSPLGRLWGVLALLSVILFIWAALALAVGSHGWRGVTFLGFVMSFVAVGPWRSQSPGNTWLTVILADLVLLILLTLPVSVELVSAA